MVENREDQESLSETMCMGTNPSGDAQPGSSQFIKEIPGRRGRSATSSVTSSPAPGTSTETSTEQLEWSTTRKYSDVSHWDHVRKLYPICGEAKSGDKQPAENQLIDQMFGLFRPYQKVMLGFAVKPNQACIKIMEKQGMHTLNCRNFPNLNLTIMKDMQELVNIPVLQVCVINLSIEVLIFYDFRMRNWGVLGKQVAIHWPSGAGLAAYRTLHACVNTYIQTYRHTHMRTYMITSKVGWESSSSSWKDTEEVPEVSYERYKVVAVKMSTYNTITAMSCQNQHQYHYSEQLGLHRHTGGFYGLKVMILTPFSPSPRDPTMSAIKSF